MHSIIVLIQDVAREPQWQLLLDYVGAKHFAETRVCCLPHFSVPAKKAYGLSDRQVQDACRRVEEILRTSIDTGMSVTVLVDGDPDNRTNSELFNPIAEASWETMLARLILAYPEVRWLFVRIEDKDGDFKSKHGLEQLFGSYVNPLFDADGLRDWVRGRAAKGTHTNLDAEFLPRRTERAIALDEETPYAHLHAYTAYRFGFRAVAVNSAQLADQLLGKHSTVAPPSLVFEDVYVNFADGLLGMSWLDADPKTGEGRSKRWPRLEGADGRVFVTSGQRVAGDDLKWASNKVYIAEQKAAGKRIETFFKPYAGIFRLWQGSGLIRKLRWPDPATGKVHHGVAAHFIWPPENRTFTDCDHHGHSSPGVFLVIAESLIERAELLLEDGIHSVQDAVRGAVLASDALELLAGRTPTVAIEALRLKQQFEVLAECQFAGVEHHIRLEERLVEIHRDIEAISRWFGGEQRETAALNAEIHILTTLMRVFREAAQFDEEQECLRHIRKLNRELWLKQSKPWALPIYPFWWYGDFLLGSVRNFVGAVATWIVVITALFAVADCSTLPEALKATFSSFIGIQPEDGANLPITILAMVSGVAHLGIFLSHLYTIISRK